MPLDKFLQFVTEGTNTMMILLFGDIFRDRIYI